MHSNCVYDQREKCCHVGEEGDRETDEKQRYAKGDSDKEFFGQLNDRSSGFGLKIGSEFGEAIINSDRDTQTSQTVLKLIKAQVVGVARVKGQTLPFYWFLCSL